MLDAGLAVLSLTTGPVLGAFVLAIARPRLGAAPVMIGMVTGAVVLTWLWWTGAVAWTWYALIGATATCVVALLTSVASGRR